MLNSFLKNLRVLGLFAFVPWVQVSVPSLYDHEVIKVKFVKKSCEESAKIYSAEVAKSEPVRAHGLSERRVQLRMNESMIFIFDREDAVSFWMKRTLIPLQLVFLNKKGKTFSSTFMPVEPNPDNPVKLYSSKLPVVAAFEFAPQALENPNGLLACVEKK